MSAAQRSADHPAIQPARRQRQRWPPPAAVAAAPHPPLRCSGLRPLSGPVPPPCPPVPHRCLAGPNAADAGPVLRQRLEADTRSRPKRRRRPTPIGATDVSPGLRVSGREPNARWGTAPEQAGNGLRGLRTSLQPRREGRTGQPPQQNNFKKQVEGSKAPLITPVRVGKALKVFRATPNSLRALCPDKHFGGVWRSVRIGAMGGDPTRCGLIGCVLSTCLVPSRAFWLHTRLAASSCAHASPLDTERGVGHMGIEGKPLGFELLLQHRHLRPRPSHSGRGLDLYRDATGRHWAVQRRTGVLSTVAGQECS